MSRIIKRTPTAAANIRRAHEPDLLDRRQPRVRLQSVVTRRWRWDCPAGEIAGRDYPDVGSALAAASAHVSRCDHCRPRSWAPEATC